MTLKPNKKFVIEITNHGEAYMARSKYFDWIGSGRTLEECLGDIQYELEFLWTEYVENAVEDPLDTGASELRDFMLENFEKN